MVKFLDKTVFVAFFLILVLSVSYQGSEGFTPLFSKWTGNGDGISWSDPKNWGTSYGIPDGSDLNNLLLPINSEVRLDIDLTLQNSLTFAIGKLIIQEGITLKIAGGDLTITKAGTLENYGTIIVDGGMQYPNKQLVNPVMGPSYIPDKSQGKILVLGKMDVLGLINNYGKIYCTKNSVVNVECEPVIEKMEKNKTNQVNLIISPLKQMQSGVLPKNVECKSGFELIFKATNGNPACVSPASATKLIAMGWASA